MDDGVEHWVEINIPVGILTTKSGSWFSKHGVKLSGQMQLI